MLRIFAGIALPENLREQLAGLRAGLQDARWVEPQDYHVTLKFIGEVDEGMAEDLDAALSAVRAAPPNVAIEGVGCFESRNKVRAVWAGVAPDDPLSALRDRIEMAVAQAGGPAETRKFKPHVTLARLKRAPLAGVQPYLQAHDGLRLTPFTPPSFQLFRSHLGKKGAHYEVIADYPLASGRDGPDG